MSKSIKQLLAASVIALIGIFPLQALAGDTIKRVIDFEVLTVGMSGNQPPMNMTTREGGLMGFDVDLAKAMARAMNVKLEIEMIPFGELMTALEKDEIDMIISNMSITLARTEEVSFVGPYMMSGMSILTKSDVMESITSTAEFNREDLTLLALKNSTHASFIKKAARDATLVEVSSYDEGVAMLIDGKGDAMVADRMQCILAILRHPDSGLTTLEKPLIIEPIGVAISKDDMQFYNLVNNYLTVFEKTGVLNQLRKKWFEDDTWVKALP